MDYVYYGRVTVVPLNILFYNLLGAGPELYGTEPWWYYVANLLLQFNVWFLLAILALPILVRQVAPTICTLKLIFG